MKQGKGSLVLLGIACHLVYSCSTTYRIVFGNESRVPVETNYLDCVLVHHHNIINSGNVCVFTNDDEEDALLSSIYTKICGKSGTVERNCSTRTAATVHQRYASANIINKITQFDRHRNNSHLTYYQTQFLNSVYYIQNLQFLVMIMTILQHSLYSGYVVLTFLCASRINM